MIVYEATKQLFVEDVVQDRIEENIDRRFYERMGYHTSKSEREAWKESGVKTKPNRESPSVLQPDIFSGYD